MFFLLFFLNICMAQDGIWKSMCTQTSDCVGHLICLDGLCTPPNPPSAEQCKTLSFVHMDLRGHAISTCPPDCGFEEEVVYGPRCIRNEQGCALASDCREEGKCSFNGSSCIETEEGCANSILCKEKGLCGFDGKKCAATNEGCENSRLCKELGWCAYMPGPKDYELSHGACVRSRSGCRKSEKCTQKGFCGFKNGTCVTNTQGCANSSDCKVNRICKYKPFAGCIK